MNTELLSTRLFVSVILFLKFSKGASVTGVVLGETIQFDCWNVAEQNQENFYVTLTFSHGNGNRDIVASYQPKTMNDDPGTTNKDKRVKFLSTGRVQLENVEYSDEGTFECTTGGFGVVVSKETTNLVVYVKPQVEIYPLKKAIMARGGNVNVSACIAAQGKPPAVVRWKTDRHLEFTQELKNVTFGSGEITTVSSMLFVTPTKYYNNQEFVCEITHPAFELPKEIAIKLNVTYPPETPVIQADDDFINLTCESDGNPKPTYVWTMPPGAPFATVKGPTAPLVSNQNQQHTNDTYICTASNGIGQPVSASINNSIALQIYSLNQGNTAAIVGGIVGAIILIGLVLGLGYFFYYKRIQNNEGRPKSSLINYKTDGYARPSIQHANDSLNVQRPPSPNQPPPDEKFDHEELSHTSESDDGMEGEHDIDLEENPSTSLVNPPPYKVSSEITSRSSVNFRARRQRPSTSSGSRKSKSQMAKPADYPVPAPQDSYRYDLPPGDGHYDEDDDMTCNLHPYDQSYPRYNNDHDGFSHQQPQYVGQPTRQPPRRTDSLPDYEPKYSEIDHSLHKSSKDSSAVRQPFEEPVEYSQIRSGRSHIV